MYVPTVVEEIELMFLIDNTTRMKITEVTKMINYASEMDIRRIGITWPFVG